MNTTGTPAPRRHALNAKLCGYLERVLRGESARHWLDGDYGPIPARAAVVALPSWRWADAGTKVGRKARGAKGTSLLMPVRVAWDPGPVVVVESGSELAATWRALGLGHTMTGRSVVRSSAIRPDESDTGTGPVPDLFVGRAASTTRTERQLHQWVTDGEHARWEALISLEPFIREVCQKAAAAIAYDFQTVAHNMTIGDIRGRVIGDTTIDTVVDRMLFGEIHSEVEGPAARLLTRCLAPGMFLRTDPMRYVTMSLRRDVEQEMRRLLDDPRIGFKVRRLYADLPECTTLDELIEQYRRRWPADKLAKGRASKALTPVQDPTANPAEVYANDPADHAVEDLVDLDDLVKAPRPRRRRLVTAPRRRRSPGDGGSTDQDPAGDVIDLGDITSSNLTRRDVA